MLEEDSIPGDRQSRDAARSPVLMNSIVGTSCLIFTVVILVQMSPDLSEESEEYRNLGSRTVLRWGGGPVFCLAWSSDGQRLAASNFGPVVRVWNERTGNTSLHEGGTEQPRFAIGWSSDSKTLVMSGLDVPVESWDLNSTVQGGGEGVVRTLDRSEGIETLCRSSRGRSIRLWGPTDSLLMLLPSSGREANSAAFSPDGRSIATGGAEGVLRVSDAATGQVRQTMVADSLGITSVAFSPDGSKVGSAGGGPVRVWDAVTGRELARFGEGLKGSAILSFSADGGRIAVAAWDGSIRIWSLSGSSGPIKLRGHLSQILALAWSPDGKTLASGGYDSTVRLWEVSMQTPAPSTD